MTSPWREQARPIILRVLADMNGKPDPEVRRALRAAYPFGPRKLYPYRIWCDEIQRCQGKKHPIGHKVAWENQQRRVAEDRRKLADWERDYGKRGEAP